MSTGHYLGGDTPLSIEQIEQRYNEARERLRAINEELTERKARRGVRRRGASSNNDRELIDEQRKLETVVRRCRTVLRHDALRKLRAEFDPDDPADMMDAAIEVMRTLLMYEHPHKTVWGLIDAMRSYVEANSDPVED